MPNPQPKQTEDTLKEWAIRIRAIDTTDEMALEMVKKIHIDAYTLGRIRKIEQEQPESKQEVLKQFVPKYCSCKEEDCCNCKWKIPVNFSDKFQDIQEKCMCLCHDQGLKSCDYGCTCNCCPALTGAPISEEDRVEAMEEMACWETDTHIKNCKRQKHKELCDKHTEIIGKPQDTESWEEDFDKKFTYINELGERKFSIIRVEDYTLSHPILKDDKVISDIKSFIKDLIEKATVEEALNCCEHNKAARTQTIDEIIGIVEGMKGWSDCIKHSGTRIDCMECQKRITCNHLVDDLIKHLTSLKNQ